MKEFKVYVGMAEESMIEVLHGGLRNDSIPETFQLRHMNKAGVCFTTQYVKIMPLSAHGQSFHTSIWHVSMLGINNEPFIEHIRAKFDEYREAVALRLVLKHLRQRRLLTPYASIVSRFALQVEHPFVSELHRALVLQGDFPKCTELLGKMANAELFSEYLKSQPPHSSWRRIHGVNADGDIPSPRGGHAMCIDPTNEVIYLLGGWDGEHSLDDFWRYDMRQDRWHVMSLGTAKEKNGPGPRSCHKMVFDVKTGCIYVLGRLSEGEANPRGPGASGSVSERRATISNPSQGPASFCSEFYRYHTRGLDAGKWDLLSFDTASAGGPPLICDHQMVIDSDAQIIYIFGGGVVDGASASNSTDPRNLPGGSTPQPESTVRYSGFYSFNIRMNKWRLLQHPDTPMSGQVYIPPRSGHTMVMDPTAKTIFIFAGQRDDKFLSDMYAYDIINGSITELYSNYTACGGPEPFFTQRAVIDPVLKEIYVFSGLTRSQAPGSTTILSAESPNWVYRYETRPGSWTQILPEPQSSSSHDVPAGSLIPGWAVGETSDEGTKEDKEPAPRYAHQVVYDPNSKRVYMHGGNGGLAGPLERPGSPESEAEDAPVRIERHRRQEGAESKQERKDDRKETRLDDFWIMSLTRPQSSEIIRRGTYMLRRQQFREMCEQQPSVSALHFLKNEVSNVVNHNDPSETESFQSLLTYLLAPSGPSTAPETTNETQRTNKLETTKKKLTGDEDDSESPPRKRSRSGTPSSDASWTNCLDGDESPAVEPLHYISSGYLQSIGDEEETQGRADGDHLAPSRFSQRTEVFEAILEFLDGSAKQPKESILDLVPLDV
ncbi:hypothetical protein HGRIS_002783 [Hohenbuehelia grisea]|uniref:Muskelin N-terminal domain-containing protein n=1 Tax=Hohenbuehelia grisea TaxID=104357 RepID=A0ABR3JNM3_9AGAR